MLTAASVIDFTLWFVAAFSAAYVIFFAIAAKWPWRTTPSATIDDVASADPLPRFLIIIPAYAEDSVIRQSVMSVLQQDYPRELFELAVVSDHMSAATDDWLASQSLTLLQAKFRQSTKGHALQHAVDHYAAAGQSFDHVVILDADNIVEPQFLRQLAAVARQGYGAIQCHRTAKNADTDVAVLDGTSEEINNSLFRLGHNAVGLSAALIGSGMCFDFDWFAVHASRLSSTVEDRELEVLLLEQRIFIFYAAHITVYDEKVSDSSAFRRQRLRWMSGQLQTFRLMLHHLPQALRHANIDYVDKTIQQMLIPRSILLVLSLVGALVTTFLSFSSSLKWWTLWVLLVISLLSAIPAGKRLQAVKRGVLKLPLLVGQMLRGTTQMFHAKKEFIHTPHHS